MTTMKYNVSYPLTPSLVFIKIYKDATPRAFHEYNGEGDLV